MSNQEIIDIVVRVLIIPILGAVATFVVKYLKAKAELVRDTITNDTVSKYIYMAEGIVTTAVIKVNQVFVDELKKNGKFDKERQQEAFDKCKSIAIGLLSENAKIVLEYVYGDLNDWVDSYIEAEVNRQKTPYTTGTPLKTTTRSL